MSCNLSRKFFEFSQKSSKVLPKRVLLEDLRMMRQYKSKFLTYLAAAALPFVIAGVAMSQDGDYPVDDMGSVPMDSPSAKPAAGAEDDDNIIKKPKEPPPPPPREFSKSESQKVCAKYKGKLISVYGEIYKLKDCVRHLVQDQEEIFKFNRQGMSVVEVDAKDVAALPVGDHWSEVSVKERPCSFFSKKYVTFSYTDIYFVENCVKRLVPDYETLVQHRKERGQPNGEVLALTSREFYSLKQGRDLTSVMDREFNKLLDGSAGVDIIPVDEACRGVEGKFVTFYSRMYKIEKCRKREIDAEAFTMKRKGADLKLIELKAEQWLSMPDGKPYSHKK
jgi:hypothetical protein